MPPKGSEKLKGRGTYMKERAKVLKECKTVPVSKKEETKTGISKGMQVIQGQLDEEMRERQEKRIVESTIQKMGEVEPLLDEVRKSVDDLKKAGMNTDEILGTDYKRERYAEKNVEKEEDKDTVLRLLRTIDDDFDKLLDLKEIVENPAGLAKKINDNLDKIESINKDERLGILKKLITAMAKIVEKIRLVGSLTDEESHVLKNSNDPRVVKARENTQSLLESLENF